MRCEEESVPLGGDKPRRMHERLPSLRGPRVASGSAVVFRCRVKRGPAYRPGRVAPSRWHRLRLRMHPQADSYNLAAAVFDILFFVQIRLAEMAR